MKIRTFKYVFKQGLIGIWRNRGMSVASIGSVAASLIILGVIITLVLNITNIAYIAQQQFDTIQVYLEEDLTEENASRVGEAIHSIEGVMAVEYESKEDALRNMKERWGEQGYLLETLENNPLPNSYIIYLTNIETADSVVTALEKVNGIEEIKYYKDIIEQLLKIAVFVRTIGLALILVLILIAMFIIANTIKLTLNARRKEINIMKYVGATNWFIRWPFFIEGVILGLIGTTIALIAVYYGYQYAFNVITRQFYIMFSSYVIPVGEMMKRTIVLFIVLGAGVGALGSIVSLRKHLRV
jgi:cell division transport system permease protein